VIDRFLYRLLGSASGINGLGWANAISKEPGDAATYGLIEEWLRTCEENHTECKADVDESPKRLLDLECLGSKGICIVQDMKPAKYVALSHCVSCTRLSSSAGLTMAVGEHEIWNHDQSQSEQALVRRAMG
jgi:hypothetical protein